MSFYKQTIVVTVLSKDNTVDDAEATDAIKGALDSGNDRMVDVEPKGGGGVPAKDMARLLHEYGSESSLFGLNSDGTKEEEKTPTLCVYELNLDGEAQHVRWFCSEECRSKWPKGPEMVYGTNDDWVEGTVCDNDECGKPLEVQA